MALTDPHAPGATPLRPEEIEGLRHAVTNHAELNELEAANIVQGQEWALRARTTRIPEMLFENAAFQPHELALRLRHRLVKVHPFPNGNGRHARMFADLVLQRHFQVQQLAWGGNTLGNSDPRRATYISAMRAADANDYEPLVEFCLSASRCMSMMSRSVLTVTMQS